MKINIGCGRDYREGWINIDISEEVKADVIMDIRTSSLVEGKVLGTLRGKDYTTKPPCTENSATEVYISGVLEQIEGNDELIHAMNECWRVLKPGGQIVIVVPNAKYAIAHRDPMDIRKFTPATFNYFIDGMQEYRDYGSVYGFKPWRTLDIQENERHILTVTMSK